MRAYMYKVSLYAGKVTRKKTEGPGSFYYHHYYCFIIIIFNFIILFDPYAFNIILEPNTKQNGWRNNTP